MPQVDSRENAGVTVEAPARRGDRRRAATAYPPLAVPLLAGLTPAQRAQVDAVARVQSYADGECVQVAGSNSHRLLSVLTGRLRVVHIGPGGGERVVRILGPGEYVGETSLVLDRPPEHFAFVSGPTVLYSLGHRDLARLIDEHPDLGLRMLQTATSRLLTAERSLAAASSSRVEVRLAAYLLGLPQSGDTPPRVTLPLAQRDIASYLGARPETLSRRMTALVRAGIVARRGPQVELLDRDRLEQLASGID